MQTALDGQIVWNSPVFWMEGGAALRSRRW
jgi:hypothetical protein